MAEKNQNSIRIDMSKPQTLSAGAASYVSRSEEELTAMIEKAEACLKQLEELKDDATVFEPGHRTCIRPEALQPAVAELFETSVEALRDIPFSYFSDQLAHILRMSRKAREIVRIRRDKLFTQSVTDILYPRQPVAGKRSVLNGLFHHTGRRKRG